MGEILITNVKDDSELGPYLIFVNVQGEMLVMMHDDGEIDEDEFLIFYEANRNRNLHV